MKIKIIIFFATLVLPTALFAEGNRQLWIRTLSIESETIIEALKLDYPEISEFEQFLPKERSYFFNENTNLRSSMQDDNRHIDYELLYNAEHKLIRTYKLLVSGNLKYFALISKLEKDKRIELVEFLEVPKVQAVPNDPLFNQQVALLSDIRAVDAWNVEKGSSEVVIAIADNNVMMNHEDLFPNIQVNTAEIPNDNIDNDNNGYVDDYTGYNFFWESSGVPGDPTLINSTYDHGTLVAGIAAAKTNNELGIAGVGYNCKLFPLRCGLEDDVTYGYEAIRYAGERGFEVINCSWGTTFFSEIRQSIVDFAVANDVAIVTSSGNLSQGVSPEDTEYPSAYFGVLGVGEISPNNYSNGVLGIGTRIMAPSYAYTTKSYSNNNTKYEQLNQNGNAGTSFAAPVVAGAVGLARSKYPNLNALQSLEFVRQMTDDIRDDNKFNTYLELLPGKLNLKKLVETDPFSIPAILPYEYNYLINSDINSERFFVGDTVSLRIKAYNHLGAAANLTFTLSLAYGREDVLQILDSIVVVDKIERESNVNINEFRFVINREEDNPIILKLKIEDDNNYSDFHKFQIIPTKDFNSFSNGTISYSVGDRGEFGTGSDIESDIALGFRYAEYGNQLYSGGLIFATGDGKVVSYLDDEWEVVKPFAEPNQTTGIVSDANALVVDRSGIEIIQEYNFVSGIPNAVKLDLSLINKSESLIQSPSVGFIYDWDVAGDFENNTVGFLPEADPEINKNSYAGLYSMKPSDMPIIGVGIYSDRDFAIAQASGSDVSLFELDDDQIQLYLNSGKYQEIKELSDIKMIIGMNYPNGLPADDKADCKICIAASNSKIKLAESIKNCLLSVSSVSNIRKENEDINIFPLPVSNILNLYIENANYYEAKIYSLSGNLMEQIDIYGLEFTQIELRNYPPGFYILQLINDEESTNKIFIKD